MAIPYSESDPQILLITLIILIVVALLLFVLFVTILKRYLQRKSKETLILVFYFGFFFLALFAGLFPMALCLWAPDWDVIYGVPLGNGKYLWWTNLSYVLLMISLNFMMFFIRRLFNKPSKRFQLIYAFGLLLFAIWSIYHGIFVYLPGTPSLTIPMSIVYLSLNFILFLMLYKFANHDAKRAEPSVFKMGMQLIAWGGIAMIVSLVIYVLNVFIPGMGVVAWLVNLFTFFLIYTGYTLPNYFRKWAEKRLNGKQIHK